jgi:hypothetical protein
VCLDIYNRKRRQTWPELAQEVGDCHHLAGGVLNQLVSVFQAMEAQVQNNHIGHFGPMYSVIPKQ